ncbi:hypothetical protein AMECASPLE_000109 [Ameca splendens]|uniref:Uncharacterized protein n=1 Tax=Ameca splendens TaxID=208324 RepID=A0ABV0X9I6_9TELE
MFFVVCEKSRTKDCWVRLGLEENHIKSIMREQELLSVRNQCHKVIFTFCITSSLLRLESLEYRAAWLQRAFVKHHQRGGCGERNAEARVPTRRDKTRQGARCGGEEKKEGEKSGKRHRPPISSLHAMKANYSVWREDRAACRKRGAEVVNWDHCCARQGLSNTNATSCIKGVCAEEAAHIKGGELCVVAGPSLAFEPPPRTVTYLEWPEVQSVQSSNQSQAADVGAELFHPASRPLVFRNFRPPPAGVSSDSGMAGAKDDVSEGLETESTECPRRKRPSAMAGRINKCTDGDLTQKFMEIIHAQSSEHHHMVNVCWWRPVVEPKKLRNIKGQHVTCFKFHYASFHGKLQLGLFVSLVGEGHNLNIIFPPAPKLSTCSDKHHHNGIPPTPLPALQPSEWCPPIGARATAHSSRTLMRGDRNGRFTRPLQ